uniref:Uncharacterized protein n=1 Tax=Streptomyces sp. NBC_00003 TaxID=2903608 RepID=A0AAU2V5E4_9ACTN
MTALKTVLTSWENRLASVRDECASLAPKLRSRIVVGKASEITTQEPR